MTTLARGVLLLWGAAAYAWAQLPAAWAQLPASGALPEADALLFHGEIARIDGLLGTAPDRTAVDYLVARTWAAGKQWPEAIDWLRKVADANAGFDPSRDGLFAPLLHTREFAEIMVKVREATPAVSRSRSAFQVGEGDLVPESMAYDPKGKRFYFGSMRKGKLVRCSDRGECSGFASGLGVVLGLKVHGDGLWVLNNSAAESALIDYEMATGRELHRYAVAGPGHTFNDLAIAANGDVYVTDTPAAAVWRLASGSPALARMPGRFEAANGITLSGDGMLLYVSTFPDGIMVVDLKMGTAAPVKRPGNLGLAAIDGLYFHRGALIAIQNGFMLPRVVRMRLAGDGRGIRSWEVLERRNAGFDGVTTGVLADGDFFYMANIQDEKTSGFDAIRILKLHL